MSPSVCHHPQHHSPHFSTSSSALFLPPLLSFFIFLLPPCFLHWCFYLCDPSFHHSLSACHDAILAASQTAWPLAPSPLFPHPPSLPSLPPLLPTDAINTHHRWVIAQTYQLPLPLCLAILSPLPPSASLPRFSAQAHYQTSHVFPALIWHSHYDKPMLSKARASARHGAAKGRLDTLQAQKNNISGTIWETLSTKQSIKFAVNDNQPWADIGFYFKNRQI